MQERLNESMDSWTIREARALALRVDDGHEMSPFEAEGVVRALTRATHCELEWDEPFNDRWHLTGAQAGDMNLLMDTAQDTVGKDLVRQWIAEEKARVGK